MTERWNGPYDGKPVQHASLRVGNSNGRIPHHLIDDFCDDDFVSQVSIDGRGLEPTMTEVGLNDPQADAGFEQMGGI